MSQSCAQILNPEIQFTGETVRIPEMFFSNYDVQQPVYLSFDKHYALKTMAI